MAWSEGRTSGGASHEQRRSEMLAGVSRIDALLDQLASDASFQQDLQASSTKRALEHWTGAHRLAPDVAEELFDEDSYAFCTHIRPCLSKLARLQHECRQVQIPLPLDRVLARERTLFDAPLKPSSNAAPSTAAPVRAAESNKATNTPTFKSKKATSSSSSDASSDFAATTTSNSDIMDRSTPDSKEAMSAVMALPWFALLVLLAALLWRYSPLGP